MPAAMSKSLAIKTKRRSTAAYAASQPLFDAIRDGMESLSEQRANLEIARSTVQRLHVKLPSSSIADDTHDSHERYMDGAVKAWRLATENYAKIFDVLADLTAADPSSGRQEGHGHDFFAKMAHTAHDAFEAAMEWKMSTPPSSRGAESETPAVEAEEEDADMEDVSTSQVGASLVENDESGTVPDAVENNWLRSDGQSADTRPTNSILQSLLDKRPASAVRSEDPKCQSVRDGLSRSSDAKAGSVSKEKNEVRAQKREERRDKRKDKRAKKQAGAQEGETEQVKGAKKTFKFDEGREAPPGFTQGNDKVAPKDQRPATPKHDDVSAEVAARLKAKEPKKEANKEKKRKRESADSNQTGVVKAEKPKKKKTRSNEGEVASDPASKETARKHERQGESTENGGARKKRKKV